MNKRTFYLLFFLISSYTILFSNIPNDLNYQRFQLKASDSLSKLTQITGCGLNYITANVTLCQRTSALPFKGLSQPASVSINGIPASATILKAYLWWGGISEETNGSVILSNPSSTTDTITGEPIAIIQDGCTETQKVVFRADVTNIITVNGTYSINGLPVDSIGVKDTDGATLMVIYQDLTAAINGTIVLYDGGMNVNKNTVQQTIRNLSFNTNTNGKAFMVISEMENKSGNGIKLNNSAYSGFIQTFWDYQEKNTLFTSGQTSSLFGVQTPNECASIILTGIYYQSAINTTTPTLTSMADTLLSSNGNSYSWYFNNSIINNANQQQYVFSESGSYHVVVSHPGSNCLFQSSPINVKTCAEKMKPNINQAGKVIWTDSSHFQLQWYIGDDTDEGRTQAYDTAFVTGNYFVQAFDPVTGCRANSDTVFINIIGVNELLTGSDQITIQNPVSNSILSIYFEKAIKNDVVIRLYDINGRTIHSGNYLLSGTHALEIPISENIVPGIYHIEIQTEQLAINRKIAFLKN